MLTCLILSVSPYQNVRRGTSFVSFVLYPKASTVPAWNVWVLQKHMWEGEEG